MNHDLSDDASDHELHSDGEANKSVNGDDSTNENVEKDDDGNEDNTARRIDPATSRKRIVRNPAPKLDTARLRGPKGVHTIEKYFEGFKFNGKGHEKNDLNRVMKRLEHWAHRVFPKYQFDDFLEKVEVLGTKRDLQTFLIKYRQDMLSDDVIMTDENGGTNIEREPSPEPIDEFDLLIAEQIEKNKQVIMSPSSQMNPIDHTANVVSTSRQTSPPKEQNSSSVSDVSSSDEVKKRIERNRQLAIERRLSKLRRDEEIKKNRVERPAISEEMISTPDTSHNDKNESNVESHVMSENTPNSINRENDVIESVNDVMMDDSDSATKIQSTPSRVVPPKPLLTDEELDKTIDDAVNQFMQQRRQLN